MKRNLLISLVGLLILYLLVPVHNGLTAPTQDSLVILHPHSSNFANHIIDGYKTWYQAEFGTSITVTTIEKHSGACWADVEMWAGNPEADVWWGGGEFYFEKARQQDLLERYNVTEDVNITSYLGGWHLKDDSNPSLDPAWYASALSGFGIIYNTEYLTAEGLQIPTHWDDLIDYSYFGHISMADPAFSGSTTASVLQLLQNRSDATTSVEWTTNVTEGWQYWLKFSGNVGMFTTSSSVVPTAVVESSAGIGLCIDYFAYDLMTTYNNIDFTFGGATTVAPDPVGILKGASNINEAKSFMDYLTSTEGQTLVGDYRTPANFKADTASHIPKAFDPFGNPTASFPAFEPFSPYLYNEIFGRVQALFTNWIVQNHGKVKAAWSYIWTETAPIIRDDVLVLYTKLPSDCNGTIAGFRALEYTNPTVIDRWKTEAAANFESIFALPEFILIDSSLSSNDPGIYQFTATIQNIGDPATAGIVPISWENIIYDLTLDNGIGTLVESDIDLDLNGDGDILDSFDVSWFHNDTRNWDAIINDGVHDIHAYSLWEGPPENRQMLRTYYINEEPKLIKLGSETHTLIFADKDSACFGLVNADIRRHPSPNFELIFEHKGSYSRINATNFEINQVSVEVNQTHESVYHPYFSEDLWTDKVYIVPNYASEISTGEKVTFSCAFIAHETIISDIYLIMTWSPDGNIRYIYQPFGEEVSLEAPPICEDNDPDVTVIGIEDGGTYSGSVIIGVSITDESDIVNATIQIKYGVIDEIYEIDLVFAVGKWTGSYDLDTTDFPDETYDVTIRVFDVCDNLKTIRLDITIDNGKEPSTTSSTEAPTPSISTSGFKLTLILILFTSSVILRRKLYNH